MPTRAPGETRKLTQDSLSGQRCLCGASTAWCLALAMPQTALTLCLSCTPSCLYPRSPNPCVSADLHWAIRESHPLSSTSCLGRQGPLPNRAGIRFQHLAWTPGDCLVEGPHKPTAARLSFPPLGDTRPTLGSGHAEGRRMTGPHTTWAPDAQD